MPADQPVPEQPTAKCPARDEFSADFMASVDRDGGWIGCEHPERRPDMKMSTFPNDCDACFIVTQAACRA